MSIQEHHEKRINNVNSRAPRKKESICQFKSTMKTDQYVNSRAPQKKGSIYQINSAPTIAQMRHCQPHDCNVRSNRLETNPSLFYLFKSRAPRKKGSICQFKSTMKKGS